MYGLLETLNYGLVRTLHKIGSDSKGVDGGREKTVDKHTKRKTDTAGGSNETIANSECG
jgi:hypothetical protein